MYEIEKECLNTLYPEIIDMLKTLTGFERGTKNLPGLRHTAAYLKNIMEGLGCSVIIQEDAEYGPTLICSKKGNGKFRGLFFAHMDTVWPEGSCKELPFRTENGFAYGAGVSDCSQGIVSAVYLLKTLNRIGFSDYDELFFIFNPDEEMTSVSSTKWIEEYSKKNIDLAICLEGPDKEGTFTAERAGSVYFEINIKGKMAHAAVNPEEGANALEELTLKVKEICEKKFQDVFLVLCKMSGGNGNCVVPDNAYAMLRYRIKSYDVVPEIEEFLKEIEGKTYIKGTETKIRRWYQGGFGPMPRLPWVEKYIDLVEKISRDTGYPLTSSFSYGGCDCSTTAPNCPTLDGLSPLTFDFHTRNERLKLSTIVPRITILTALIEESCNRVDLKIGD